MASTSIGKADGEGVVSLGSQAWNIADGFTKIKILRILIQLDLYETVAVFGRNEMEEEVNPDDIPYKRAEAFDRMIFSLKQLLGNCKFSIEKGDDEKIVRGFMDRLENVERVADGVSTTIYNDVTKENTLRINETHFKKCFDILRSIKDELNFPINRAGLIFKQSEEMDLDKMMNEMIEGG